MVERNYAGKDSRYDSGRYSAVRRMNGLLARGMDAEEMQVTPTGEVVSMSGRILPRTPSDGLEKHDATWE